MLLPESKRETLRKQEQRERKVAERRKQTEPQDQGWQFAMNQIRKVCKGWKNPQEGLDWIQKLTDPERECLEKHPDVADWRSVEHPEELHDMTEFGMKLTMAINGWGLDDAQSVGLRYRPGDEPSVGKDQIFEIQTVRGNCAKSRGKPPEGSETWKFW